MFKLIRSDLVQRLHDGAFIPTTPGNRDYQEFLAWVAQGNTADPADPPPPPDTRRAEALDRMQDIVDDAGLPPKLRQFCQALKRVL